MGQSPEELEAERRLAAEEAERARQAVIEAKVMEVSPTDQSENRCCIIEKRHGQLYQ